MQSQNILEYNLNCVVNHVGNVSDGHYNTMVKIKDKWFFMDDDVAFEKDSINVIDNRSYILFYDLKD